MVTEIEHFEGVPKFDAICGGLFEPKGPKFKLPKSTFNAKNFLRRLSRFWFINHFGAIHFWIVRHSLKLQKNR